MKALPWIILLVIVVVAATLDSIDKSVGEINVAINAINQNITRIDGAVQALAAE